MPNNRVSTPQAMVINGIDAGGAMQIKLSAGYDKIHRSSPDGLQVAMVDREAQYLRGSFITQDWVHAVELLTGTVGTKVFYERKSGVAAATGYIEHTITNPVIHRMLLQFSSGKNGSYATVACDFECRAADATKGFADMWTKVDNHAAPTYVSAARGGYRIETLVHGELAIYHTTRLTLSLAMKLVKECNDADVGYTCVDAQLDNMMCTGSISSQDSGIADGQNKALQLLAATRNSLVANVTQGQGATDKVLTIAGVQFNGIGGNKSSGADFSSFDAEFEVTNNITTQLTLAGDNKIITIADAA